MFSASTLATKQLVLAPGAKTVAPRRSTVVQARPDLAQNGAAALCVGALTLSLAQPADAATTIRDLFGNIRNKVEAKVEEVTQDASIPSLPTAPTLQAPASIAPVADVGGLPDAGDVKDALSDGKAAAVGADQTAKSKAEDVFQKVTSGDLKDRGGLESAASDAKAAANSVGGKAESRADDAASRVKGLFGSLPSPVADLGGLPDGGDVKDALSDGKAAAVGADQTAKSKAEDVFQKVTSGDLKDRGGLESAASDAKAAANSAGGKVESRVDDAASRVKGIFGSLPSPVADLGALPDGGDVKDALSDGKAAAVGADQTAKSKAEDVFQKVTSGDLKDRGGLESAASDAKAAANSVGGKAESRVDDAASRVKGLFSSLPSPVADLGALEDLDYDAGVAMDKKIGEDAKELARDPMDKLKEFLLSPEPVADVSEAAQATARENFVDTNTVQDDTPTDGTAPIQKVVDEFASGQ